MAPQRLEREGSPPRVRSTSISSMSQLLLQGWAMLADSCPDCGVPLMRHPAGTELLCTNCGRDTTSADTSGPSAATPAAPQPASEQTTTATQPVQQQERMANGTGGTHTDSSSDDESVGLLEPPPSLRSRLRPELGTSAASAQPAVDRGAAQQQAQQGGSSSDASKAIADMMVEGWAMLQDHCPRCLNPLLRSRDRQRIYCAGCQMFAVRQGEQQSQQQLPAAAVAQPAGAGAMPAAAARAMATAAPPAAGPQAVPAPGLREHLPVVHAAAAAVAARLSSATSALAAAGPVQAQQLLAEVQQCAAALRALANCDHSLAGEA